MRIDNSKDKNNMIIAIDARRLERELLSCLAKYLNLGIRTIYRPLEKVLTRALNWRRACCIYSAQPMFGDLKMDGLRQMRLQAASKISAFSSVRDVLLNFQRQFQRIFPLKVWGRSGWPRYRNSRLLNAEYKLFITASVDACPTSR